MKWCVQDGLKPDDIKMATKNERWSSTYNHAKVLQDAVKRWEQIHHQSADYKDTAMDVDRVSSILRIVPGLRSIIIYHNVINLCLGIFGILWVREFPEPCAISEISLTQEKLEAGWRKNLLELECFFFGEEGEEGPEKMLGLVAKLQ